jgi:hypothetical protein
MAAARRGYRVRVVPPYYKAKVLRRLQDQSLHTDSDPDPVAQEGSRAAGDRTHAARALLTILVQGY